MRSFRLFSIATAAAAAASAMALSPPSPPTVTDPATGETMPRKTVLVTGAAGFVGSHVADYLLGRGDNVVIVDEVNDYYSVAIKEANLQMLRDKYSNSSSSSSNSNSSAPKLSIYRGDICDSEFMERIFATEPLTAVCHMAARAGVRPSILDPFVYVRSNIVGTVALMELAVQHGILNFVLASSSSVYGGSTSTYFSELERVDQPISPYAATKKTVELLGHAYAHARGLRVAALRFFTVYGPRGRPDMAPFKFIDRVSRGQTIQQFGDGTSSRDYTYVDDIVQGVVRAVDTTSNAANAAATAAPLYFEVLNLGKGSGTVLKEFLAMVEKYVGRSAVIQVLPDQPGDVPYTCANVTIARHHLGYQAVVPFEQGIQRTVAWYKESYHHHTLQQQQPTNDTAAAAAAATAETTATTPTSATERGEERAVTAVAKNRSRLRQHRRQLLENSEVVPGIDDDEPSRLLQKTLQRVLMEDSTAFDQELAGDDELLEELLHKVAAVSGNSQHRRRELKKETAIVAPHTQPKKVLVTGGAGFLGSHVVHYLLARGDSVVVVDQNVGGDGDNGETSSNNNSNLDFLQTEYGGNAADGSKLLSIHQGDVCDGDFMEKIFAEEKPEWICHLAARSNLNDSFSDPVGYIHANVESTVRLLELSKGSESGGYDIQNFVLASSDAVYGMRTTSRLETEDSKTMHVRSEDDRVDYPKTPYGASKKSAELLAFTYHHLYQIPVSALRLFSVYGPRYRRDTAPFQFVDRVLTGDNISEVASAESSSIDYTYVDDVVEGIVRSLDRPYGYEIMNLGGGACDRDTTQEFVLLAAELAGKSIALADQVPTAASVDGLSCASVDKAAQLLEYKPAVTLAEGVQRTVAWHQQTYYPHSPLPEQSEMMQDAPGDAFSEQEINQRDADDGDDGDIEDGDDSISEDQSEDDDLQSIIDSQPALPVLPVSPHSSIVKEQRAEKIFSSFPVWLRSFAIVQWILVIAIITVRAYFKGCINPFGGLRPHDEHTIV